MDTCNNKTKEEDNEEMEVVVVVVVEEEEEEEGGRGRDQPRDERMKKADLPQDIVCVPKVLEDVVMHPPTHIRRAVSRRYKRTSHPCAHNRHVCRC